MLGVGALVVALGLAESGLRVLAGRRGPRWVHNLEFDYTVTLNRDGFRDTPFAVHRRPGHVRILFIGDSFVYGSGVAQDQTIPVLMEQEFTRHGAVVEVYNLGVPGADTWDYVEVARRFASYEADVVLLGVYVDNDLFGDSTSVLDRLLPTAPRSYLWQLLRRVARERDSGCRHPFVQQYPADPYYIDLACRDRINPFLIPRAARARDEPTYYARLARRFDSLPAFRNNMLAVGRLFPRARYGVVLFPSKYQVSAAYFPELRRLGFHFGEGPVAGNVQQNIAAAMRAAGTGVLDLLPTLRASRAELGRNHYHRIDGHLNALGDSVAARAVVEWLRSDPAVGGVLSPPGSGDGLRSPS